MDGLTLGAICIVIGIVALQARADRPWYAAWTMPTRDFRAAIPAGVLSAAIVMALVITAIVAAAGPAPR